MTSNTPIMNAEFSLVEWLTAWIKVVTKPGEQTFADITETSEGTLDIVFISAFVVGTFFGMVLLLVGGRSGVEDILKTLMGIDQFSRPISGGVLLLISFCLSLVAGLLTCLYFVLDVALVHWIAKLLGGGGTFEQSVYLLATIAAPVLLANLVLIPFYGIPFVGLFILVFVENGINLYALFLRIMAVKTVNRFGWGRAAVSVLIPFLVNSFIWGVLISDLFFMLITRMD